MFSLYHFFVNNLLVLENNAQRSEEFKKKIMQAFEMNGLGLVIYFIGMEIRQSENEIFILQKHMQSSGKVRFHEKL